MKFFCHNSFGIFPHTVKEGAAKQFRFAAPSLIPCILSIDQYFFRNIRNYASRLLKPLISQHVRCEICRYSVFHVYKIIRSGSTAPAEFRQLALIGGASLTESETRFSVHPIRRHIKLLPCQLICRKQIHRFLFQQLICPYSFQKLYIIFKR